MKSIRHFLTIIFISFVSVVVSQNCIPSVIVFTTQAQVDNFPSDYPGCTMIDGNVGVTGDIITNLDSLSQLTKVGGSIQIIISKMRSLSILSKKVR